MKLVNLNRDTRNVSFHNGLTFYTGAVDGTNIPSELTTLFEQEFDIMEDEGVDIRHYEQRPAKEFRHDTLVSDEVVEYVTFESDLWDSLEALAQEYQDNVDAEMAAQDAAVRAQEAAEQA